LIFTEEPSQLNILDRSQAVMEPRVADHQAKLALQQLFSVETSDSTLKNRLFVISSAEPAL